MMRILAAAAVLASLAGAGQAPSQQPPVFRGGTDLVEVDVVVHDKSGAFVSDLSADDFIVEDAGKPQPVLQFYLHVSTPASWTDRNASSIRAEAGGPTQSAGPRVFVVVFDDAHLTPAGFKRTQDAALKLFQQQFRAGDVGGVVAGGRMAKNRLSTDREELIKAVKDAKPNATKNLRLIAEQQWPRLTEVEAVRIVENADRIVLEEAVRRACDDDPSLCPRIDPEPSVRSKASELAERARAESLSTLQVLRTLATGLAGIPGRKTIVLMSEGFLAENEWPMVEETLTLAARANARIYTLDARGQEKGLRTVFDAAPTGNDTSTRLFQQMDFDADSVNSLAVDSGGFVVRNMNQFDKAIARIGDEAGNYYVLGIRPATAADGKFHRVSVKVKRPGLNVRARRGYVAVPAPARSATTTSATAAAAPPTATAAEADPKVTVSSADRTEPEPVAVEATLVPHTENSTGLRVRPDAELHANTLAGGSNSRDADATAGWEAYQRGDVDTARARLSAAVARSGADSWMYYTLGMANYALRQFRDAATAWESVRNAAPDFEPVYFDLIDAYLQMKEHDQATRIARSAMERWPRDPELSNALGVVQTSRGALDDAVKSFQAAIAAAPSDATGYFNLGKALELRFFRSRRYVQQLHQWISNDRDRNAAIENYQRYVDLGGAYADAARAGLERLKWVPGK